MNLNHHLFTLQTYQELTRNTQEIKNYQHLTKLQIA